MTKEEVLEKLVGAYTAYFNIRRDTELDGLPVAMDAEYHVHNEQYVLSREAKLWEAENDEYAFVVVLQEGGSGANAAGNVAAQVLDALVNGY